MTIWILRSGCYNEYIEGVYTTEAKIKKEHESLLEAIERRDHIITTIEKQIEELTAMRNPVIYEAEAMLTEEAAAKEANHTGRLKEVRKKRKTLLRQAEKMTSEIHRLEQRLINISCFTQQQILANYGRPLYFEEHVVEGS